MTNSTSNSQVVSDNEEKFDLLNEDGSMLGVSKRRSLVHRDGDCGDWHRSVHIWLFSVDKTSKEISILLQMRSPGKDTFPNCWDVSSAGHVGSGDVSFSTAIRELEEELGLSVNENQLEFVFSVKSSNRGYSPAQGAFIDNEIQDVYALYTPTQYDKSDLKLQESEVSNVKYIPLAEYKSALQSKNDSYVPRPDAYQEQLFEFLESKCGEITN
uniref:Nudix hydrolase domain-containing protein n=1 Tax=Timspurckia oligopyrenoides TaxID=708627 RepID=A0A7S0ZG27_9RHOD|mmetsp:Transcript_3838/g.6706  ORF Transcript_3838/g.6706 Transcript_3838/m.6706 type:complete len:213 (+) Transcript_3838:151-789(+)